MLELKGIGKEYQKGSTVTDALEDLSVTFRTKEFVAIMGPSGSGKSTILNIIAGLENVTCGTIMFRGRDLSEYTTDQWDSYRNKNVGYLFQEDNLLNDRSVLENVMLPVLASGVDYNSAEDKAYDILKKLGIAEYAEHLPQELSYGQQHKAGLARALINDPDILLCDEPTGPLDWRSSKEIMDLLKEESESRLVVAVTHEMPLVNRYADRILFISNGRLVDDSKPFYMDIVANPVKAERTAMNYKVYARLGLQIVLRRWKRLLKLVVCCGAGIACFMLALMLSNEYKNTLVKFESSMMQTYPVLVTDGNVSIRSDIIEKDEDEDSKLVENTGAELIYPYDPKLDYVEQDNVITTSFREYVEKIDPRICAQIEYVQRCAMNLIRKDEDGNVVPVSIADAGAISNSITSTDDISLATIPEYISNSDKSESGYIEANYDVICGRAPQGINDIALVVDDKNRIDKNVISGLGLDDSAESIKFNDIVGMKLINVSNNDYYVRQTSGLYQVSTDMNGLMNCENNIELEIVGILRPKIKAEQTVLRNGIIYSNALAEKIATAANTSQIVVAQRTSSTDVFTGAELTDEERLAAVTKLSGDKSPSSIILYPTDIKSKEKVIDYLDEYNDKQESNSDKIYYTDLGSDEVEKMADLLNGLTYGTMIIAIIGGIIAVVIIVLTMSMIVQKNRREIGMWKAVGAGIYDVFGIFGSASVAYGLISGIAGIIAAIILLIPMNLTLSGVLGNHAIITVGFLDAFFIILMVIAASLISCFIPLSNTLKEGPLALMENE